MICAQRWWSCQARRTVVHGLPRPEYSPSSTIPIRTLGLWDNARRGKVAGDASARCPDRAEIDRDVQPARPRWCHVPPRTGRRWGVHARLHRSQPNGSSAAGVGYQRFFKRGDSHLAVEVRHLLVNGRVPMHSQWSVSCAHRVCSVLLAIATRGYPPGNSATTDPWCQTSRRSSVTTGARSPSGVRDVRPRQQVERAK